jgi:ABC-type uncharacterized transport system ATPase subunit
MFVNKKEIIKKIEGIMAKYNLKVDLNKITSKATVGEQQRAEILKILYRDADILVFDEPTAVLTPIEIDGLLDVMLQLKKDGKTIIFITHKMAEIKKVVNTATVSSTGLSNFDLKIRRGEIVAIAGVEGNGQQEIAQVITGMMHPDSGKVLMHDHDITRKSIAERYKKWKISHIPEDRHKHGLVLDNTVIENMALQDISSSKFSKLVVVNSGKIVGEVLGKDAVREKLGQMMMQTVADGGQK